MALHLASDLFLLVLDHGAANDLTSNYLWGLKKRKGNRIKGNLPHSFICFSSSGTDTRSSEEEMGTDISGFLNIYSHYVLPHTWQAVTGMAVNVALINRWRV